MSERPIQNVTRFDSLRETIRSATRDDRPIIVRGGGTFADSSTNGAATLTIPHETDPTDYWPEDMTIRVPAGMTLFRLNEILAQNHQELPIDAADPRRTTVGGLIACGLSGARRLSRGTVRDALIGLTVIDASGDLLAPGGRVVKNVAGYDLCKLMLGSWGWLGAIVEATFRIRARPEASQAVAFALRDADDGETLCDALLAARLSAASLDMIDEKTARRSALGDEALLIVGFEGLREDVSGQIATAQSVASRVGRPLESAQYASLRQQLADMALSTSGYLRMCLPSSKVAATVARLRQLAEGAAIASHLASGIVMVDFDEAEQAAISRAIAYTNELNAPRLIPRALHSAPHAPMVTFTDDARHILPRVKSAFDPAGIFGRGSRFATAVHFQ